VVINRNTSNLRSANGWRLKVLMLTTSSNGVDCNEEQEEEFSIN
jgi:hypothetical protein